MKISWVVFSFLISFIYVCFCFVLFMFVVAFIVFFTLRGMHLFYIVDASGLERLWIISVVNHLLHSLIYMSRYHQDSLFNFLPHVLIKSLLARNLFTFFPKKTVTTQGTEFSAVMRTQNSVTGCDFDVFFSYIWN